MCLPNEFRPLLCLTVSRSEESQQDMSVLLSCHCRAGLNYHPVSSYGCLTAVQSHRDICWTTALYVQLSPQKRIVFHNSPPKNCFAGKTLQQTMFIAYCYVSEGDLFYLVFLRENPPTSSLDALIFFYVKRATLNFLLSLLCGPPFKSETKPHALTKGLNLISFLIYSNQPSYDRS